MIYIFMVFWTIQGTIFFIQSEKDYNSISTIENKESQKIRTIKSCIQDSESYALWIAWSIINYFVVLVFAILLLTWYDIE